MAAVPGLPADLFFPFKLDHWRENLPDTEDEDEASEEERAAAIAVLGFDPAEIEEAELDDPLAKIFAVDRIVTKAADDGNPWNRKPGPRSQNRWENSETGRVKYQKDRPSAGRKKGKDRVPGGDDQPSREPRQKRATVEEVHAGLEQLLSDPSKITPDIVHHAKEAMLSLTVKDMHEVKKKLDIKGLWNSRKGELAQQVAEKAAEKAGQLGKEETPQGKPAPRQDGQGSAPTSDNADPMDIPPSEAPTATRPPAESRGGLHVSKADEVGRVAEQLGRLPSYKKTGQIPLAHLRFVAERKMGSDFAHDDWQSLMGHTHQEGTLEPHKGESSRPEARGSDYQFEDDPHHVATIKDGKAFGDSVRRWVEQGGMATETPTKPASDQSQNDGKHIERLKLLRSSALSTGTTPEKIDRVVDEIASQVTASRLSQIAKEAGLVRRQLGKKATAQAMKEVIKRQKGVYERGLE